MDTAKEHQQQEGGPTCPLSPLHAPLLLCGCAGRDGVVSERVLERAKCNNIQGFVLLGHLARSRRPLRFDQIIEAPSQSTPPQNRPDRSIDRRAAVHTCLTLVVLCVSGLASASNSIDGRLVLGAWLGSVGYGSELARRSIVPTSLLLLPAMMMRRATSAPATRKQSQLWCARLMPRSVGRLVDWVSCGTTALLIDGSIPLVRFDWWRRAAA